MKFKDITPFGVRLPTEVKEKLQRAANKNTRSMNAEIVARMAASFEVRTALKDFTDGELVDELIKRWGRENVSIRLGKEG